MEYFPSAFTFQFGLIVSTLFHPSCSHEFYLLSLRHSVLCPKPPLEFHHPLHNRPNSRDLQEVFQNEEVKNWTYRFIDRRRIRLLPERWAKVVANDGQYFET
nr:Mariner Mos1 transposase [Hymenolepis microstoma]